MHELCGFPHTAVYLVVSLDGHRHMATLLNQIANQIMKIMVDHMASAQKAIEPVFLSFLAEGYRVIVWEKERMQR